MNAIRENPLIDNKGLMHRFTLTKDALTHRLEELRNNGWLDVHREVDVVVLGYRLRYRIDVKINPSKLKDHVSELTDALRKAKKQQPSDGNPQKVLAMYIKHALLQETKAPQRLCERIIVEDVAILMGDPADLTISVRVKDHEDIFQFVTGFLRPAPGVENTSTSLEAWSVRAGKISHANGDDEAGAGKKLRYRSRT